MMAGSLLLGAAEISEGTGSGFASVEGFDAGAGGLRNSLIDGGLVYSFFFSSSGFLSWSNSPTPEGFLMSLLARFANNEEGYFFSYFFKLISASFLV